MRRFLVLLFLGAAAALGLWFGLRSHSVKASSSAVTSLLPRETVAFVHVPDFSRTRAQWHESDVYKLWREPAVQEFLQKPLTRVPANGQVHAKLQELDTLALKDAFLAITSWENNQLKMLGGFRFKGSAADAEKVIGPWRTRLQQNATQRETLEYERHSIDVTTRETVTLATVYDGDWFFAANDVSALKALLDRVDKRVTDTATTLAAEENFTAAFQRMPASYAALAYGRLDQYFEKLAGKLPQGSAGSEQLAMLRQVRSVAAASAFEKGKFRDVLFVTMPQVKDTPDLMRTSLPIATNESFLYTASVLNLAHSASLQNLPPNTAALPAALQRFVAAFSAKGIKLEDFTAAFGSELGLIGEWPENSRLPAAFATLPVKDAAKARAIVSAVISTASETKPWTTTEQEGVQYFSLPPENPMVPVSPTIGISSQFLLLGINQGSVEAALKRGTSSNSLLAAAQTYKTAERLVPEAKQSFAYLNSALLYQRLDAALRPMLVLATAFMPAIADTVDLAKLPPAEVITKHLSPFVMSQTYQGDGYLTSSIGPVSFYQGIIGAAAASGAGAAFYQRQLGAPGGALDVIPNADPAGTPP